MNVDIITYDHAGKGEVYDQERPLTMRRPCDCGCDQRDAPDMVGYINAIADGKGFTIRFHDEETFQHVDAILKALA